MEIRGELCTPMCEYCESEGGIYRECRALEGWFGNACGNCKRNDWGARCTLSDTYKQDREDHKKEEELKRKEVKTTRAGRTIQAPVKYTK